MGDFEPTSRGGGVGGGGESARRHAPRARAAAVGARPRCWLHTAPTGAARGTASWHRARGDGGSVGRCDAQRTALAPMQLATARGRAWEPAAGTRARGARARTFKRHTPSTRARAPPKGGGAPHNTALGRGRAPPSAPRLALSAAQRGPSSGSCCCVHATNEGYCFRRAVAGAKPQHGRAAPRAAEAVAAAAARRRAAAGSPRARGVQQVLATRGRPRRAAAPRAPCARGS